MKSVLIVPVATPRSSNNRLSAVIDKLIRSAISLLTSRRALSRLITRNVDELRTSDKTRSHYGDLCAGAVDSARLDLHCLSSSRDEFDEDGHSHDEHVHAHGDEHAANAAMAT